MKGGAALSGVISVVGRLLLYAVALHVSAAEGRRFLCDKQVRNTYIR
jgi:hypothetical protein